MKFSFIRRLRDRLRRRREQATNKVAAAQEVEGKLAKPISSPKQLWYPKALRLGSSKTHGTYWKGYPVGAVVHYTAGNPKQRLVDAVAWMMKIKCSYFVIDQHGNISQSAPLNRYGSHAGSAKKKHSFWKGLGWGVSKHLVGIEVCCPGRLNDDLTPMYGGKPFDEALVRRVKSRHNIQAGTYYKFTDVQERALTDLLLWLKSNNPSVFDLDLVLGHDEVSGKGAISYQRKIDPGASLSMTMPQFRKLLKETYNDDSPRYS